MNTFKRIILFGLSLLIITSLFFGCSSSWKAEKEKSIGRMSDDELVSYYRGLNDRIKEIDSDYKREQELIGRQSPNPDPGDVGPHFLGTDSYGLNRTRKLVINEMERRGIKP